MSSNMEFSSGKSEKPIEISIILPTNAYFLSGIRDFTLTLAKIPYFGFGLRSLLGKVDPTDGKVYGSMVVNSHPKISNKLVRLWALLFANFN